MGLTIVLFVPEGVVMASDGLAFNQNDIKDDEYAHKKQQSLILYRNKYLIGIPNHVFIHGILISYYIQKALNNLLSNIDINQFIDELVSELIKLGVPKEQIVFYIAGHNRNFEYDLFLYDRDKLVNINTGNNGERVYNFHSMGRTVWIDKLLYGIVEQPEQSTEDQIINIDFSKYSIGDAVDFAYKMIAYSHDLDYFTQVKQIIGEQIDIAYIDCLGNMIKIKK